MLYAAVCGVLTGLLADFILSFGYLKPQQERLTRQESECFVIVWVVHTGLYTGLLIGAICSFIAIKKKRLILKYQIDELA